MLIFKFDNIECWLFDGEYYVYGVNIHGDPRIVPSEDMAWEIACGF